MALTTHISQKDKTQTPYQIDPEQTLRASQALLRHVQAEVERIKDTGRKPNLLAATDSDNDEGNDEDSTPIWLHISTKNYIADKSRLKPSKIAVPHSLNTSEDATICLITTDPQRAVKNVMADVPTSLSSRVTRIIGLSKLAARYKSFDNRRQLLSEHDIFLADERILGRLPKTLGKIFYKDSAKRPIPINIAPKSTSKDKNEKKLPKAERQAEVANADVLAKEIQKALACVPVTISPGTNISVRVGLDSFKADQIRDNAITVANAVIEKHVPSGWRNVRSIHIKTATSMAVPVWLAADLQPEASDAKKEQSVVNTETKTPAKVVDKKRKSEHDSSQGPQAEDKKRIRLAEQKARDRQDTASRKARLLDQKAALLTTEA